jgi:predicted DCC family thiol-disulfide oxidoreductase YuxK
MRFLHRFPIGFDRFLASESSLWAFQILTELLLFLGAIGLGTRIVIPLCAVSVFVFQGILREYSGFWHQNLVPAYVLTVLSFTPCGDGWSIDRLRRIYQDRAVPDKEKASPVYGWARYACWVPIALTYAAAGFSKIRARGLEWVSATNMRALLYEQTLYPRASNFSVSLHLAHLPDSVFVFLGIAAVCGEALFITVLFSRSARRIMPALTILMHIGIIFLQNIVFFDLILLLLIFYDFTWVCNRIGRWLNRAGPIQILYDGSCRLCSRSVRILASADILGRLEFQDFRRLNLLEFNQQHKLGLTPEALEQEMVVRAKGKVYAGFEAYHVIAWALAPWLSLPGSSQIGTWVYGAIAGNRYDLLKCNSSCLADGSSNPIQSFEANTMRYSLRYAVAVAAVFAAMGTIWLNRIEYYPFTSVQMFTHDSRGVVRYYKTLGHRESGQIDSFNFEDTLPVFSINSRYEVLFDLCFGQPLEIDLCKKTLSILGSAYNKQVAPAERLTGLEIQRWAWDFGSSPRDPNYGQMEQSFLGEIPARGYHLQAASQK